MRKLISILLFSAISTFGCSDAGDLLELAFDSPDRKPINQAKVGVNNFFNQPQFGSEAEQFSEIRNTLGVRFVRILFAWTDDVQRTPDSDVSVAFFDRILSSIPPGVDVLIVVAHSPAWMANPANWSDGNPRATWVRRWLAPLVERYAGTPGVVGWEIWNEPDRNLFASDVAFGLEDPANYLELLRLSSAVVRRLDPGKRVVIAATESIQSEFPSRLDYNKSLRDLGAESLVDVWNIHYYGTSYESVVTNNGVADFLNSLRVPVWVTESGEQGPNKQLAYVETAWPFLEDKVNSIERFYYYEFASTAPTEQNFGLRTTDPAFPVSDLYINLRDN